MLAMDDALQAAMLFPERKQGFPVLDALDPGPPPGLLFILGIDSTATHLAPPNPLEIAEPSFLRCRASDCTSGSREGAGLGCPPQSVAVCIRAVRDHQLARHGADEFGSRRPRYLS